MPIFGTRPEAIKMAPVIKALAADPARFVVRVAVTAQHRELLDQTLRHFEVAPDHDLDLMRERQSLTYVATAVLAGLEPVLASDRPDLVLVHGDTATTCFAALAAFYQRIPSGHVEAGLRSGDKYQPYPEEMNRRLAGAVVDLHFAPTQGARANLLAEGVSEDRIWVTGNTAIDALKLTVRDDYRFTEPNLDRLGREKRLVLVDSLHRRENFGPAMGAIYRAVRRIATERPDVELVVALHKNPEARDVALRLLSDLPRVRITESLDYPDWVNLMARAYLVVSDSGGIQEEAPSVGTPVLLLRDVTERPEAIEAGTVRMVGTDETRIFGTVVELLDDPAAHARMARASNPFGDGRASERVVEAIDRYLST